MVDECAALKKNRAFRAACANFGSGVRTGTQEVSKCAGCFTLVKRTILCVMKEYLQRVALDLAAQGQAGPA